MSGARGDALDWALALAQAPGERDALRQRPLPNGIEGLLQIAAGGHGAALHAAMARTGESEATLVEAVRFYLREVLFHSGADAYRMLGLAHDASSEQIKGHHRLLQLWLHPDRHTSDWDAIFAGRVNAAWNALRTPERRAAYDAAHPARHEGVPASSHRAAPRVLAGDPIPVNPAAERWRRRAPVLALFAACAVLGVAAVRDALRDPGGDYAAADRPNQPVMETDAVALQLPRQAASGSIGPTPARPAGRAAVAAPAALQRPAAGVPEAATVPRRVTAQATIASAPAAPVPPAAPLPKPVRPEVSAVAPPTPTAATPTPAAPVAPGAADPARVRSNVPIASAPAIAPPSASVPKPATVPKQAAAPPAVAVPASPERVQLAQRAGSQLLAFLSGGSKAIPPIWDSLAAQQRAVALRDSLRAAGAVRAGDPAWRVGDDEASLRASFGGAGQLRAQLVWREQAWLVSGVTLEQAR